MIMLEDNTHASGTVVVFIHAPDIDRFEKDITRSGLIQIGKQGQQRRFPRPGAAHNRIQRTGMKFGWDSVQDIRLILSVTVGYIFQFQQHMKVNSFLYPYLHQYCLL